MSFQVHVDGCSIKYGDYSQMGCIGRESFAAEWILSMLTIINVSIGDEDEGEGQGHCEYVISRIILTGVSEQISFNRAWISQVKWLMTWCPQKCIRIAMIGIMSKKKALDQAPMAHYIQTQLFIIMVKVRGLDIAILVNLS